MKLSYKAIIAAALIVLPFPGQAQTSLTWDANTVTTGAQDGAGTWSTTNANWWTGSADVVWTNGDEAVFGSGSGAAGTVTIASGGVTASEVVMDSLGAGSGNYTISGGTLTPTGTTTIILINASGNTTFTCPIALTQAAGAESTFYANSGATLTLSGGMSSVNGLAPEFTGTGSIVLAGPSGSYGTYSLGTTTFLVSSNVTITNAQVTLLKFNIGQAASGTLTVNNTAAILSCTDNAAGSGGFGVGRSGHTGTLNVEAGTTSLIGTGTTTADVVLTADATSGTQGTLNVSGGTFNMTNTTLVMNLGTAAGQTATATFSGGTSNINQIQFGGATNAYASGTSATVNITGGAFYIGSGGIIQATYAPTTNTINFSGGTVGANEDWTSTVPMTLSGTVTYQASAPPIYGYSAGPGYNITMLSGAVLSGTGNVVVTGPGMLVLQAADTYTGSTTVKMGTLQVDGSLSSSSTVTVCANTNLCASLAGAGTVPGSVTIGNGTNSGYSLINAGDIGAMGTLTTGAVTMGTESGLSFNFNSNTGAIGLLKVNGALALGNGVSALVGSDLGNETMTSSLSVGTVLVLAQASSISGTFIGLADGSSFTSGDYQFQINYGTLSGYSNKITLKVLKQLPQGFVGADAGFFNTDLAGGPYTASFPLYNVNPLFNQPTSGDSAHMLFFDNLAEQIGSSQVDFIAPYCRGYTPNNGAGDPHLLSRLVSVLNTRGLSSRVKIAIFDDNQASWCAQWNDANGYGYTTSQHFDVSNPANWVYAWNYNYKVFFDNVPDANRFKINGRPVILIWTLDLGLFSNTQGNASKLIAYVRQQCEADYGFNPYIIVSDEFPENDTTCTNAIIDTDEAWFNPWLTSPPVYSWTLKQYVNSASQTISTGVCVAQYNEVNSALGLDGVIDPNHGVTLQTGLQKTADLHYPDEVTFIEGFSDWEENAAIWRVNNLDSSGNALTYATTYYDYPNQRIEVLRQHAKNLFPIDLKMDAVSCDSFSGWSGTPSNYYRNGAISNSISPTTDTTGGYYVSMTAGQTLQWSEAQNAQNNPNFWGIPINGTVHINVRVATNNATSQLYFVIDGTTYSTVTLPNTGGLTTFATVSMGSYALAANSYHVVQLVCPTGTVNLHYWQLAP